MNVNGVTSTPQAAAAYSYSAAESTKAAQAQETKTESASAADTGVIYEPSSETAAVSAKKPIPPIPI